MSETEIDFEHELQSRLQKLQEDRLAAFDPTGLAWLALLPAWTLGLAKKCGFPNKDKPLEAFLTEAGSLGLCDFGNRHASTLEEGGKFWMPESIREEVISGLRRKFGPTFLHEQTLVIAGRVQAESQRTKVSPLIQEWATLADLTKRGTGAAADRVAQRIESLLRSGDTGGALALVRTASYLAEALGGQLESAVLRATRLVELAYRAAQDERHLLNFLPRHEAVQACVDLLDGPDDLWALHLIGMGGVGKTTLIRHIVAKLAPSQGWLTTRVDFDHMSPDYPVLQPEQLLVELADELRVHSEPTIFENFQNSVRELRDALNAQPGSSEPLAAIHHPFFNKILRLFVDWLKQLPARTLIILDTCEELAKVQPVGIQPRSITATFEILERIHKGIPSLRVIFAGRRLLALSGHKWQMAGTSLPRDKKRLPAKKDFLRMHEIRGFTFEEAYRFFDLKGLRMTQEMREAILFRSRETGTAADLQKHPNASTDIQRYNPFDVALYANWLREDPSLTADKIASGQTDPYVESRIVTRVKRRVGNLLPSVVLLRRFDKLMLRPAAPQLNETVFDDIYRELGQQEWTDYQPDDALKSTFLEIDRMLYPRLRKYFSSPERRHLLEQSRNRIGPELSRLIQQRPLEKLGVDYIRAALQLLPAEDAMDLWDNLNARVLKQSRWSWVTAVSARLLGEAEEGGEIPTELMPAIWATYASGLLHEQSKVDIGRIWDQVARATTAHRFPEREAVLEKRARLGQIAGKVRGGARLRAEEFAELESSWTDLWKAEDEQQREQIAAAIFAAVEELLEVAEGGDRSVALQLRFTEVIAGEGLSVDLLAFAHALRMRISALNGAASVVAESLSEAERLLHLVSEPTVQRWLDWVAPVSLRDRIRLEILRITEIVAPDVLSAWQREAQERLNFIDADRLVSSILQLRLKHQLVAADELIKLKSSEVYDQARQPLCVAHCQTLPLFATIALGWLALGRPDNALSDLDARLILATQAGQDAVSVHAAERVKFEVIRRMRLFKRAQILAGALAHTTDPEMAVAGWPLLAVNGLIFPGKPTVPDQQTSSAMVHTWWASQPALDREAAKRILEVFTKLYQQASLPQTPTDGVVAQFPGHTALGAPDPASGSSALGAPDPASGSSISSPAALLEISLELDCQEARLLASRFSLDAPQHAAGKAASLSTISVLFREHNVEQAVRMMLRSTVLSGDSPRRLWLSKTGARRAAEIAIEEGELLAMRLPEKAAELFETAYDLFSQARDPVGTTIAAICHIISLLRKGPVGQTQAKLEIDQKLQPAYQKLWDSKMIEELPSWSELVAITSTSDSAVLQRLDHASWSGWLHRLSCCLASSAKSQSKSTGQMIWLARHYNGNFPSELILPKDTVARPSSARKPLDWLEIAIKCVAGTLLFAIPCLAALIIAAVAIRTQRTYDSNILGLLRSAFLIVWCIVSVAAAAYTPLAIIKIIRSILTAKVKVEVYIATQSAATNLGVDATIPVLMWLNRHKRNQPSSVDVPAPPAKRVGEGRTPGLRPYSQARDDIPAEVLGQLARWQARLTGRGWWNRLAVGIRTAPSVTRFAWEAVLAPPTKARHHLTLLRQFVRTLKNSLVFLLIAVLVASLGFVAVEELEDFLFHLNSQSLVIGICSTLVIATILLPWRRPGKELVFYRTDEPRADALDSINSWRTGAAFSVCSRTWTLLAESVWQTLRVRTNLGVGRELRASVRLGPPKAAKLLHLIGLPVRTTAGLRLQVPNCSVELRARAKRNASNTREDHLLIGPEDLSLNSLPLVVLQGEPATTISQTDSRREQAATLRAFGAELFAAGARAIVVFPSLPPVLAEKALASFARRLRGKTPPNTRRLLAAAAAARTLIASWNRPRPYPVRWVIALFSWAKSAAARFWTIGIKKTPFVPKKLPKLDESKVFDPDCQLEMAFDVCVFIRPGK